MALINDIYVFVKDEDVQRGVNVSSHPVETGINLTDNVKREPIVIRLNGEIVGANASTNLSKLQSMHHKGEYVKYIGRNVLSNAIISSFNTSHPNTIHGGCSFDMEIMEIRIAKSPVSTKAGKNTKGGTKQITQNSKATSKVYTVKKGDTLWAIAKSYYGNGAKYTKIATANKLSNPNLIKIGQKLVIPD